MDNTSKNYTETANKAIEKSLPDMVRIIESINKNLENKESLIKRLCNVANTIKKFEIDSPKCNEKQSASSMVEHFWNSIDKMNEQEIFLESIISHLESIINY